jgi:hypothetical protein
MKQRTRIIRGIILTVGGQSNQRKTYPIFTLSNKNPTCNKPESMSHLLVEDNAVRRFLEFQRTLYNKPGGMLYKMSASVNTLTAINAYAV